MITSQQPHCTRNADRRLRRAAWYPRGAARGPQARRAAPLNPDLCVGAPFQVLAPESGDPPVRAKMVAVICFENGPEMRQAT